MEASQSSKKVTANANYREDETTGNIYAESAFRLTLSEKEVASFDVDNARIVETVTCLSIRSFKKAASARLASPLAHSVP